MKNRNQKQESIIKTLAEESRFINQEFDELFPTDEEKAYDYFDSFDEYKANATTKEITFIELAILNSFLHDCFSNKNEEVNVTLYGQTDSIGRIDIGGVFDKTNSFWFMATFKDDDNQYLFQTKIFNDSRNDLYTQFHITVKNGVSDFESIFKKIMSLAFNQSEYKGKCIKVKLNEGRFRGIEIIEFEPMKNEIILNETQRKFIDHFVTRVDRGSTARYLLNGEPGTGKTESIREIARKLMPNVTFIIPDFVSTEDLTSILEACEIFEKGVIIMDDIDLYLGSRDNGSYTRLLGQFLSFFDGVKKRKISLLASTNDKGLVDKAAERPGRFSMTIDYGFLDEEQIIKVCNIHLPIKWQIKEVYDALNDNINGKKVNITGAFISCLAENIVEMSQDYEEWGVNDTVMLIKESYKGFYASQVERERQSVGFNKK